MDGPVCAQGVVVSLFSKQKNNHWNRRLATVVNEITRLDVADAFETPRDALTYYERQWGATPIPEVTDAFPEPDFGDDTVRAPSLLGPKYSTQRHLQLERMISEFERCEKTLEIAGCADERAGELTLNQLSYQRGQRMDIVAELVQRGEIRPVRFARVGTREYPRFAVRDGAL